MLSLPDKMKQFAAIAKLLAYFLIYQYIFVVGGQFAAYMCYRSVVGPVAYEQFTALSSPEAMRYNAVGLGVGMLLSGVAMIAHLLLWKYVRVGKGFLREVNGRVLVLSVFFVGSMMVFFNIAAAWLGLENDMGTEIELMMGSGAGILSVAVVAPALEELLFRGAIQGSLMRLFKSPWVGIIAASLLFGIIHINPIQVFYASCLGMGFGWLYYRTRSLLPVIVGHIINNSVATVSNILYGVEASDAAVAENADCALFVAAGLFALLFALLINKLQPAVPSPWSDENKAEQPL